MKRRESVKQLTQERKQKLLSSQVLHQFLWDVNEVGNEALFCSDVNYLPRRCVYEPVKHIHTKQIAFFVFSRSLYRG